MSRKKLAMGPEERIALRRQLKKMDFFKKPAWIDVDALAGKTVLYEYSPGTAVFKQGAKADGLYMVLDGAVEVKYKKGLFRKASLLDELGAGHFFGEMALMDGSRRTATVKTIGPTRLFVLSRDVIDEMLLENDDFRDRMRAIAETRKFLNSRHT
jgi:CRP-like cAMP-binding protein